MKDKVKKFFQFVLNHLELFLAVLWCSVAFDTWPSPVMALCSGLMIGKNIENYLAKKERKILYAKIDRLKSELRLSEVEIREKVTSIYRE